MEKWEKYPLNLLCMWKRKKKFSFVVYDKKSEENLLKKNINECFQWEFGIKIQSQQW